METYAYTLTQVVGTINFSAQFSKIMSHYKNIGNNINVLRQTTFVCLFDLILYVHSTIFQLCGKGLPGFNQY